MYLCEANPLQSKHLTDSAYMVSSNRRFPSRLGPAFAFMTESSSSMSLIVLEDDRLADDLGDNTNMFTVGVFKTERHLLKITSKSCRLTSWLPCLRVNYRRISSSGWYIFWHCDWLLLDTRLNANAKNEPGSK